MTGKKIAVFGSTGSVGTQALEVIRHLGLSVRILTGNNNDRLIEEQARLFSPEYVWISDEKYKSLKTRLADTKINVMSGNSLIELASDNKYGLMFNSMLGISGLEPTLAAITSGHDIALANKETLVAGGSLVMDMARKKNIKIIPVDSEHSAILQCMTGKPVKKILLTASGGAFFGRDRDYLKSVTPETALKHPNWSMGAKITVDSGTLMNKGLELIEAVHLFDMPHEKIEVIIHRESVIHSMVEYIDNTVIAQLGQPDMRSCIQYAVTYPERCESLAGELDLFKTAQLTFFKPDTKTFTLLSLARYAIEQGGNIPAVMNGANEEAVELFLKGIIKFTDIFEFVERITRDTTYKDIDGIENIIETDREARQALRRLI